MNTNERTWRFFQLLVMILTFLFFPGQKWQQWFYSAEELSYAELHLKGSDRYFLIAKNNQTEVIYLPENAPLPRRAVFRSLLDGSTRDFVQGPSTSVHRETSAISGSSYSILEFDVPIEPNRTTGGTDFRPQELHLLVPSEQKHYIAMMFVMMLAAAGSTYSFVRFYREAVKLSEFEGRAKS